MREQNKGSKARLKASFTDDAGKPKDPASVSLLIVKPNGSRHPVAGSELDRVQEGTYAYTFEGSEPGLHAVQWIGDDEKSEPELITVKEPS